MQKSVGFPRYAAAGVLAVLALFLIMTMPCAAQDFPVAGDTQHAAALQTPTIELKKLGTSGKIGLASNLPKRTGEKVFVKKPTTNHKSLKVSGLLGAGNPVASKLGCNRDACRLDCFRNHMGDSSCFAKCYTC
jgi:hypothetical protein